MTERARAYIVTGTIKICIRSIWTPLTISVKVEGVASAQQAVDAALAAQQDVARQQDEDAIAVWNPDMPVRAEEA